MIGVGRHNYIKPSQHLHAEVHLVVLLIRFVEILDFAHFNQLHDE